MAATVGKQIKSLRRFVQSLNPHHQGAADLCDFSNYRMPSVTFISPNEPIPEHKSLSLSYFWTRNLNAKSKPNPFPPNTTGHLYYHSPLHLPPSAGELRFRLANITTAFQDGQDLLTPRGIPWNISVLSIARRPPVAGLQALKRQLLAEDLITHKQLEECADIPDVPQLNNENVLLHELSQPFPIRWSSGVVFWAISGTPLKARKVCLKKLFRDLRKGDGGQYVCPFDGSALVRFERATLPGTSKLTARTVVLRILKFTQPLSITDPLYDDYIPTPIEGGLVQQNERKHYAPWSCDVDNDKGDLADVLKMLVEEDEARGRPDVPVESILDRRPKADGGYLYLVRWRGLGPEMDSWVEYPVVRSTRAWRVFYGFQRPL